MPSIDQNAEWFRVVIADVNATGSISKTAQRMQQQQKDWQCQSFYLQRQQHSYDILRHLRSIQHGVTVDHPALWKSVQYLPTKHSGPHFPVNTSWMNPDIQSDFSCRQLSS